jgi:hypothetical protein
MRPASETEWCGERNGRVVARAASAASRPEREWILVHSRASSKERGGRMVAIRFASIALPEPGGRTRRPGYCLESGFDDGWDHDEEGEIICACQACPDRGMLSCKGTHKRECPQREDE